MTMEAAAESEHMQATLLMLCSTLEQAMAMQPHQGTSSVLPLQPATLLETAAARVSIQCLLPPHSPSSKEPSGERERHPPAQLLEGCSSVLIEALQVVLQLLNQGGLVLQGIT